MNVVASEIDSQITSGSENPVSVKICTVARYMLINIHRAVTDNYFFITGEGERHWCFMPSQQLKLSQQGNQPCKLMSHAEKEHLARDDS